VHYFSWIVTVSLLILFFWLYKKKKFSGKKATTLFFVVKGVLSTTVILFGMFNIFEKGEANTQKEIIKTGNPDKENISEESNNSKAYKYTQKELPIIQIDNSSYEETEDIIDSETTKPSDYEEE
jgi:glucan phosphoethanolaminetransferase (alkaline phosphatase superfamily)